MSKRTKTRWIAITMVLGLWLLAAVPARAQQSGPPKRTSYLFQVVLLVAERDGTSKLDEMPKNARAAVEDVKDFLPFRSYRFVDAVALRSNGGGRSLMNGPGGEDYEVSFDFRAGPSGVPEDELAVERFFLTRLGDNGVPQPSTGNQQNQEAIAPAAPRRLISTSFSVVPGETIVVGTSKLEDHGGGGAAVVVLVTAVP